MKEEIEYKKNELNRQNTKVDNLRFYRNLHTFLSGSYTLITASGFYEMIANNFDNTTTYVPLVLGSVGIVWYSIKTVKETNYKLNKEKNKLCMLEQELQMYSTENEIFKK